MNSKSAEFSIPHHLSFGHDTPLGMVKYWESEGFHEGWQLVAKDIYLETLSIAYSELSIDPDSEYWSSHLRIELEKLENLLPEVDIEKIYKIVGNSSITFFEKVAMLRELQMTSKIESSEKKIGNILG